jgi:hypothetical protein
MVGRPPAPSGRCDTCSRRRRPLRSRHVCFGHTGAHHSVLSSASPRERLLGRAGGGWERGRWRAVEGAGRMGGGGAEEGS